MARYKNEQWILSDTVCNETVVQALLMDLRDELQALNGLLNCANCLTIPVSLRRIARNTARPKKKAKR